MCGLAGFWDTKHQTSHEQLLRTVSNMRDKLLHRGPDAAGNWVDADTGIALGHRRLSIVDLSAHGAQPMLSHSGRYVIVFNGEIYNHQAIKDELNAAWRGHSDTEIILAAFDAWGIEPALQKFVGMFAIAVWDKHEQQVFLIRDRMGEKPLYYGWLNDQLVFGSELKSLKAHPAWQQAIDRDAVSLLMRYNSIPAPYTIYENIFKLEPGHILLVKKDKQMQNIAYWQLKNVINTQQIVALTPKAATDQLEQKLSTAIRLQMLADVPVGAFLSGGIDSSTVVALMQAQSTSKVKTFTIGFDDIAYNEADQAKKIAQHLQTQHTELYLSAADSQAVIPNLAEFYDEPFADSSQIPTYIVSRLTREHVTVSLSGDGGDELFAGYPRYSLSNNLWRKIAYLPKPARALFAQLIIRVPPQRWDQLFMLLNKLLPERLQQRNAGQKLHKLADLFECGNINNVYDKLLKHWDVTAPDITNVSDLKTSNFTETMMYMDSMRYLPDDILVKVDRAGMAVSLETRMPFLDHRVVEFAWSLPLDLKIRNGQSKWILRQVLNRHVPPQLYDRPKMGFGVPIDHWLRGPLKEWANDLLAKSMLNKHNILDPKLVQKKWQDHLSGSSNWQSQLWSVLIFQSWYEAYHG